MIVQSLHVYPVKGARGIALETADVLASGLRHDRRFLVLNQAGTFVTQRTYPRMALVETALSTRENKKELILSAPNMGRVTIDLSPPSSSSSKMRRAKVFNDDVEGIDLGGEGASFFSEYLGETCSLLYMPLDVIRQVELPYAKLGDRVGFADGYPILIASLASLADLNERLAASGVAKVPMNRFRPNVVVDGAADPYAEDRATTIQIGAKLSLRTPKRCGRCQVVTIDQATGQASKEPLRTLASYRTDQNQVHFATNAIPDIDVSIRGVEAFERIAVGDNVFFST